MLHAIAANQGHKNLVRFGANTLLGRFNEFLGTDQDTFGFVVFDGYRSIAPIRTSARSFKSE